MMEAIGSIMAGNCDEASQETIQLVLGIGDLVAVVHKRKREQGRYSHKLRLLRVAPRSPAYYSHRFRAEDVLELPRLARELAGVLLADGSLSRRLEDDLACMASCLDWVFRLRPGKERSGWTVVESKDLQTLLDYLWDDELRSFQECSDEAKKDHIFHAIVKLSEMLNGKSEQGEQYLRLIGVSTSEDGHGED